MSFLPSKAKPAVLGNISNGFRVIITIVVVVFVFGARITGATVTFSGIFLFLCAFHIQVIRVDEMAVTIKWPLNIFKETVIVPLAEIKEVTIECVTKAYWIKFEMKNGTELTVRAFLFSYELRSFQRCLGDANIRAYINSFYW